MQAWTHRKLLASYLQTIGITLASFLLLAVVLAWFTTFDFAAFIVGFDGR